MLHLHSRVHSTPLHVHPRTDLHAYIAYVTVHKEYANKYLDEQIL